MYVNIWDIIHCLRFLKHDVSEIGSVSVLRLKKKERIPSRVGPLEKGSLFHWSSEKY
jgi:hypothetical protein